MVSGSAGSGWRRRVSHQAVKSAQSRWYARSVAGDRGREVAADPGRSRGKRGWSGWATTVPSAGPATLAPTVPDGQTPVRLPRPERRLTHPITRGRALPPAPSAASTPLRQPIGQVRLPRAVAEIGAVQRQALAPAVDATH